MTFRKTGINSVESSEGYSIQRKDRFELEYTDSKRTIIIEVESGDGLAIYASSFDSKDKVEILYRVKKALEFMGIKYEIC